MSSVRFAAGMNSMGVTMSKSNAERSNQAISGRSCRAVGRARFSLPPAELAQSTGGNGRLGQRDLPLGHTLTITNSANPSSLAELLDRRQRDHAFLQSRGPRGAQPRGGRERSIPQSVIDGILLERPGVPDHPSGVVSVRPGASDVADSCFELNLSDQDLLNGRLRFTRLPARRRLNAGVIDTSSGGRGGRVYPDRPGRAELGPDPLPAGQIVLAAGKSVELVSRIPPS